MKTPYYQIRQFLLLSLLFWSSSLVQAADSGGMELPYRSPLPMLQVNHSIFGKVVETMDSPPYTYVLLDTGARKVWAAGPITPVKVGDSVSVSAEMPMQKFHSKTLKRDFDVVYFSNRIGVDGKSGTMDGMNPHHDMNLKPEDASLAKIKKANNGKTIAEIYAQKTQLVGKRIRVRGKVMKYTSNVFGKNWLHIQDGSSQQQLIVITPDKTEPGAVIVVEGTVTLNKDNGIGHVYEVALENASLSKK
jgi:hypothetical protein